MVAEAVSFVQRSIDLFAGKRKVWKEDQLIPNLSELDSTSFGIKLVCNLLSP